MSARTAIFEDMQRVATEQKLTLGPLEDATPLMATGLDSLGFAVLVARLEARFGVDPFSASDEIALPTTLGEMIALYDRALA